MNFYQCFANGCLHNPEQDIDGFIQLWHESIVRMDLHHWLGLTREEYGAIVEKPKATEVVLMSKLIGIDFYDIENYGESKITSIPEAVEYFVSAGFEARRRDWSFGATVMILGNGTPSELGNGIISYDKMLYIVANNHERCSIITDTLHWSVGNLTDACKMCMLAMKKHKASK